MPDESRNLPEIVKGPLLQNTGCILAISVWNDAEAVALSKKFGAVALLDKANFYIGCSLCRRAARAAIPIEPSRLHRRELFRMRV